MLTQFLTQLLETSFMQRVEDHKCLQSIFLLPEAVKALTGNVELIQAWTWYVMHQSEENKLLCICLRFLVQQMKLYYTFTFIRHSSLG